jgi:mono/diheme cytochrome c family protein
MTDDEFRMNDEMPMTKARAAVMNDASPSRTGSPLGLLSSFVIRHSSFALCALLLTACGPLPGKPTAADVEIAPRDVRDFAALYRLNCAGCHGDDGHGNGAPALDNRVWLEIASDAIIREVIAQGRPGTLMPAFSKSDGGMLVDEQVDILVQGIRKWANRGPQRRDESKRDDPPTPVIPPYAATAAGDAKRGATVYATACASCHGPEGKGAGKMGSIVDGSYLALVSDQYLRNIVVAGLPGTEHPNWRGSGRGEPLTNEQITDVVAWLSGQRAATPGQPYTANP